MRLLRRCILLLLAALSALPALLLLVLLTAGDVRPPQPPHLLAQRGLPPRRNHVGNSASAGGGGGARSGSKGGGGSGVTAVDTAEAAERMAERRAQLRDACAAHGLDAPGNDSLHQPNPWEFFVARRHKLIWCNVFKAASTSWMYNFNLLAGYSPKFLQSSRMVPLTLARRKYPRPSLAELETALNDSVSFLIVRHPLERLVSAYRDKLEYSLPHTIHERLGTSIILKYRKGAPKGRKPGRRYPRWPTFPEFVRFLVDEHEQGHSFDMHWATVAAFCTPCQVRFDVIVKFETLQEDQNYLIHLANLQDFIKPQWKNPAKGRTTAEVIAGYYSQLTKLQILQLYNIYKYDFELFGYTLDGYMELAEEDQTNSAA